MSRPRTRYTVLVLAIVLVSAATLATRGAVAPASAAASQSGLSAGTAPAFGHVFVIVGENTALGQLNATNAPYLMNTVRPHSAWVTNYSSFKVDGSLANYIGLTSGQYIPCEAHNNLPDRCHQNVDNVFSQLNLAGMSWRQWSKSATGPCDFMDSGTAWNFNTFSAHHIPAVYYDSITGGVYDEAVRPSPPCMHDVLPMGSTSPNDTSTFDAALASGDVGNLNLVVPNDCENGHDKCRPGSRLGQFDAFLAREIPKIEASPAFGANGAIFVTYDEGADKPYPNRFNVLLAAMGPTVQDGTYEGGTPWGHYSLLRALESGFNLSYLGGAQTARPLDIFSTGP
jgi:hypothetical protein